LVIKVNCSSSVFNYNQTHFSIKKNKKIEQIVEKASESAQPKICLHLRSDDVMPGKTTKTFFSVDSIAISIYIKMKIYNDEEDLSAEPRQLYLNVNKTSHPDMTSRMTTIAPK